MTSNSVQKLIFKLSKYWLNFEKFKTESLKNALLNHSEAFKKNFTN
jgi:hypothetical protein